MVGRAQLDVARREGGRVDRAVTDAGGALEGVHCEGGPLRSVAIGRSVVVMSDGIIRLKSNSADWYPQHAMMLAR